MIILVRFFVTTNSTEPVFPDGIFGYPVTYISLNLIGKTHFESKETRSYQVLSVPSLLKFLWFSLILKYVLFFNLSKILLHYFQLEILFLKEFFYNFLLDWLWSFHIDLISFFIMFLSIDISSQQKTKTNHNTYHGFDCCAIIVTPPPTFLFSLW